ncbi:hypothetical protein FOMPIDRAFT_1014456 [Fomitopsis schrenkii]|uniref:Zn(2)-C6 fungal-type domain-containing protein n=1 Tax=Fomitopsis schrenkii TaxID=2126942 RepID=S8G1C4_FOMSC|nr:hypothetical protein FOMPIDRAFT_1014456 [Fomitopsis schrenkii]
MAAPSATHDELASTGPFVKPAPAPPMDGTLCPSMLYVVAPQLTRPIAFGAGGLAGHAFVPPAVQPMPASASDQVPAEADNDLAAGVETMAISRSATASSQPQRPRAVATQKAAKLNIRPPRPPRPTRSCPGPALPLGRPVRTRREIGKRTPQACERCRYMKTKCNGARPNCARCTRTDAKCTYILDHKAVRTQLRQLQRAGLIPESIPLSSGRSQSHSTLDPSLTVPIPFTFTLSCPGRMLAPEFLSASTSSSMGAQGMYPGHTTDGTSRAADHPGYVFAQAPVPQPWARAQKKASSLPQRLTVPTLSGGSSASSSSSCTPLVTPTEERSFQLGAIPNGLAVLFGTSGEPQKHGARQQQPNYPPPIMPYPGRSFPLMTTSGEYFEEARLVPELCGGAHNLVAIPANAYILPHGAVNAGTMKAKAIWMDAAVPGLRQDAGPTVQTELFGRE